MNASYFKFKRWGKYQLKNSCYSLNPHLQQPKPLLLIPELPQKLSLPSNKPQAIRRWHSFSAVQRKTLLKRNDHCTRWKIFNIANYWCLVNTRTNWKKIFGTWQTSRCWKVLQWNLKLPKCKELGSSGHWRHHINWTCDHWLTFKGEESSRWNCKNFG